MSQGADIFDSMCQILRVQLSSDPLTTILGIFNDAVGIDSAKPCFISYCIIFAKKLILTRWKERDNSLKALAYDDVANALHLD